MGNFLYRQLVAGAAYPPKTGIQRQRQRERGNEKEAEQEQLYSTGSRRGEQHKGEKREEESY